MRRSTRHWPEEPLLRLRHYLPAAGCWSKEDEEQLLQETAAEIDAAADAYLGTPPQDPATIFDYTFANLPADLAAQRDSMLWTRPRRRRPRRRERAMSEISLVQAVNLALARAMAEDERVLVLGEDVGADGGVFRATDGLLQRFGPDRVLDTPLAEAAIAGLSVGLAAQGFRPVAEIQFTGFHLSDHRSARQSRLALADPDARAAHLSRWSCARPAAAASARSSIIRKAPKRCSPIFRACGSSFRPRHDCAYGLLLAAIRDPDPVRLPRADAALPRRARGGGAMTGRRCRSTAASFCAKAAM